MGKWGTRFLVSLLISGSLGIGYGVWRQSVPHSKQPMAANPLAHLPDYVQQAASTVQVAYQFALDNPDLLEQIPCYCGCEKMLGHKHNLDCYISAFKSDGSVAQYTDHAAYCAVCLDITLAVGKMAGEGQTVQAMHTAMDVQYGYSGPHTHPGELVQ